MRAVYDKQGRESMDKVAQGGMDDPAGFFAAVFGGERFYDYVRIRLRRPDSHPIYPDIDWGNIFDEGDDLGRLCHDD
jgi:hypothetical protein